METVSLIDPDTGTPTLALEDAFGTGLHTFKYAPDGRTFVTKRSLEAVIMESVYAVLQEKPLVSGRFSQLRDTMNGKNAAMAACNYSLVDTGYGSGVFRACTGGPGFLTVYVGDGGQTFTVLGNKNVYTGTAGISNLTDVAYGISSHVAVSVTGKIWRSTDNGQNWVERANPTGQTLNAITYGDGKFVAVGNVGAVAVSLDDGDTFSDSTVAGAGAFADVVFDGKVVGADVSDYSTDEESEKFYAIESTNSRIYRSDDALSWVIKHTFPSVPKFLAACHHGVYVLLASGSVARSYNGYDSYASGPVISSNTPRFMAADPSAQCLVLYDDAGLAYITLNGVIYRTRPMVGGFPYSSLGKARFVNGRFMLPGNFDDVCGSLQVWR